ncbi:MAG TPA: glycosyltransferase, partial [Pyrinomonadaceae bacterium]|nr:glycosyltransferase [Pyrinomonadaceae bacterium]
MHIGLDGLPLTSQRTGVGHYTWELAVALAELAQESEIELLYPSNYPPIASTTTEDQHPNLRFTSVNVGPVGRHWWSTGLPGYLRKNKFDLFHGTNYDVPLWRRCATVLTIHDLSLILFPETHRKRSVSRARRRLPLMAKTADAIITPSKSVKQEVCEHLNVAVGKVFVVPEAARGSFRSVVPDETEAIRARLNCGEEFLLAVGTIEPRKNLTVLLDAFEELMQDPALKDLRLVIAGGRGWLTNPFFEKLAGS